MGKEIAIFGKFSLVRDAEGREVLIYSGDGSVSTLPPTVDSTAEMADEPPNCSESEHNMVV